MLLTSVIMTTHRREFLIRFASAAGAFALVRFVPGCSSDETDSDDSALSATTSGRTRKAWHTLSPAEKDLYRKAVVALNKEPASFQGMAYRTSFQRLAFVHNNSCPHGNWFFLPWHRVYLAFYESELIRVLGNEGKKFALPYWDWSVQPKVPAEFWDTELDPYVLHKGTEWALRREIDKSFAFDPKFVGADTIKRIMTTADFYAFASGPSKGTNGHADRSTTGRIEGTPHNYVHGTMGGNMGNFLSPMDPIFWLHHGNIDRLWNVWMAARAAAGQSAVPYNAKPSPQGNAVPAAVGVPTLPGVTDLNAYWMGYSFTLRADDGEGGGGDVLQGKSNKTSELLDSRAFRVFLKSGSPVTVGYGFDTDPPAARAATRAGGSKKVVVVDFKEETIFSTENGFDARLQSFEAKPAIDAFKAASDDRTMTGAIANLPIPDDQDVLDAIVVLLTIQSADGAGSPQDLGAIAFHAHGVSGPHNAHVQDANLTASSVDLTDFFAEFQASGAVLPNAVMLRGRYAIKNGVAEPAGWAAFKAKLPSLLHDATKGLHVTLIAAV